MPLIEVIIILIVIGFLLWLANSFIPIDSTIKKIMNFVAVLAVIMWLLTLFFPNLMHWGPRVGR